MKKVIQVTETRKEQVSIEVDFPIFRKHDLMEDEYDVVIYYRWDGDGTEVRISCGDYYGGRLQFEVETSYVGVDRIGSDADFILGRGQYSSSKSEFMAAAQRVEDFLIGLKGK